MIRAQLINRHGVYRGQVHLDGVTARGHCITLQDTALATGETPPRERLPLLFALGRLEIACVPCL